MDAESVVKSLTFPGNGTRKQPRIYAIVTYWGYPFGGGEQYMMQTLDWLSEHFDHMLWLSFCDKNNRPYPQLSVRKVPRGWSNTPCYFIDVPGGFGEESLMAYLRLLRPTIVHHQGHRRVEIVRACNMLNIPVVTGFHFWIDAVVLDERWGNEDIMGHVPEHKKDERLDEILAGCARYYCASSFMRDALEAITGVKMVDIPCYSDITTCSNRQWQEDDAQRSYVCMINVHEKKGGRILLECIKRCPDIPFLGVCTEPCSGALDDEIRQAMQRQGHSVLWDRREDVREIYNASKILLVSSLVDETFCRVAFEGLANGLPIVTTGTGNIGNIVGNAAITLPNDPTLWAESIQSLYANKQKLLDLSKRSRRRYEELHTDMLRARNTLAEMFQAAIAEQRRNVMIFCPWADQGLGIQSRRYATLLMSRGFKVSIFSFMPYYCESSSHRLQNNPKEWQFPGMYVYYSPNNREKVTDEELRQFVVQQRIGACLMPEVCWYRVFEIADFLATLNVRVMSIPNIEIVLRSEMPKHHAFHTVLCNNRLCMDIFRENGFENVQYLGYSPGNLKTPLSGRFWSRCINGGRTRNEPLRFLCLGGMNAFYRKNIVQVMEAFSSPDLLQKTHLVVTIQVPRERWSVSERVAIEEYSKYSNIQIVDHALTGTEIEQLYANADIAVQVSKQEGLGLGFFEPLMRGLPVITLDVPPHNEIVLAKVFGWTIAATYSATMNDNKDAFFSSAEFSTADLLDCLRSIVAGRSLLDARLFAAKYKELYSESVFVDRFESLL